MIKVCLSPMLTNSKYVYVHIKSAADYHWPDLFKLLAPDIPYSNLTSQQKRDLMHNNPLIVSYCLKQEQNCSFNT